MRLDYFFVCVISGLSKWRMVKSFTQKGKFERCICNHEEIKSYQ